MDTTATFRGRKYKRVWLEDDATRQSKDPDHEYYPAAWKRLYGYEIDLTESREIDSGDAHLYWLPSGSILIAAHDADSIWEPVKPD